ncbi:MAG: family 10 glycosylhydrolase [Prevotella sp.]|nr:family 10 glycosylhydrolase [Prevotella sp.]
MRRLFFAFLACVWLVADSTGANPAIETRAVWLTTNFGLDWSAAGLSVDSRKAQLRDMLDKLCDANFNTVLFQVRIRGDVLYRSNIEPLSPYAGRGFDPLQFAIDECHRRGMECHAWFVTYPVGNKRQVAEHGQTSVVRLRPDICKFFGSEWYLDPGNPATRRYILSLIDEIVQNYDIDGLHLDYIRYPDRPAHFPDNDAYRRYGGGMSLADWRRNNVNMLVAEIYDAVKKQKPWVQVSSAPVGKYRSLNDGRNGWTAYESVYQDAGYWMRAGKHDALYPMMYYRGADFEPFLRDWKQNSNNRLLIPGLGVYQLLPQEKNWSAGDITGQIDNTRRNGIKGQAYFRAGIITANTKGIDAIIRQRYYRYPAKLPPMTWLDNIAPNSPTDLEVFLNNRGKLCLRWKPDNSSEAQTYTVYCSTEENVDTNAPDNILATGIHAHHIELDMTYGDFGFYYSVSASDRFHNESVPCFPAYFAHTRLAK